MADFVPHPFTTNVSSHASSRYLCTMSCMTRHLRCALYAPSILLLFLTSCEGERERVVRYVHSGDYTTIVGQLDSTDMKTVCAAASLISWARSPTLVPNHLALLNDRRCGWRIPIEAAWRLAEGGKTGTVPQITSLLDDPMPEIRWNIAHLLGSWRTAAPRERLQKCADSDSSTLVQQWCRWALCRQPPGGASCQRPNMVQTTGANAG